MPTDSAKEPLKKQGKQSRPTRVCGPNFYLDIYQTALVVFY